MALFGKRSAGSTMNKKVLAGVIATALVIGSLALPTNVSLGGFDFGALSIQATETVDSGTCGDNLTWVLEEDGVLTISGTGSMYDCTDLNVHDSSNWDNYIYYDFDTVVIEDGVTSIGDLAFFDCPSLTRVDIPDSVTSIGREAFFACQSLTNIDIPDSVTSIGYEAFHGCISLLSIEIPDSVTNIGDNSLGYYYIFGALELYVRQVEGFTIYGYAGSAAETYAESNGFTFVEITDDVAGDVTDALFGDVNLDGDIDYLDAMTVLRADAELIELTDDQLSVADVNGDGSVDSLDAILILRYDAGLIESF